MKKRQNLSPVRAFLVFFSKKGRIENRWFG
jgi:hypothetical protein